MTKTTQEVSQAPWRDLLQGHACSSLQSNTSSADSSLLLNTDMSLHMAWPSVVHCLQSNCVSKLSGQSNGVSV